MCLLRQRPLYVHRARPEHHCHCGRCRSDCHFQRVCVDNRGIGSHRSDRNGWCVSGRRPCHYRRLRWHDNDTEECCTQCAFLRAFDRHRTGIVTVHGHTDGRCSCRRFGCLSGERYDRSYRDHAVKHYCSGGIDKRSLYRSAWFGKHGFIRTSDRQCRRCLKVFHHYGKPRSEHRGYAGERQSDSRPATTIHGDAERLADLAGDMVAVAIGGNDFVNGPLHGAVVSYVDSDDYRTCNQHIGHDQVRVCNGDGQPSSSRTGARSDGVLGV